MDIGEFVEMRKMTCERYKNQSLPARNVVLKLIAIIRLSKIRIMKKFLNYY